MTGRNAARTLLLLAVAAVAVGALALAGHRLAYRGKIQPGVTVSGVPVGGLTAAEALETLAAAGYDPAAPVHLRSGDAEWSIEPLAAGIAFDARATVAEAYRVGRSGPLATLEGVATRFRPRDVARIVSLDRTTARRVLEHLADGFDVAAADASLEVVGLEVHETAATHGRALNVEGALTTLAAAAGGGAWPIEGLELPYNTIPPEVTTAGEAVLQARALLTGPVTVRHGQESWELKPEVLAGMLATHAEDGRVVLGVGEEPLAAWLAPAVEVISRTAEAPRFRFDAEARALELVQPGVPARRVDVTETARHVIAAPDSPTRSAWIAVRETPPEIADDVTAQELGIRELVVENTSRYVGSPAARIHNIELAAARFDGVLVPPDAVYSFNEGIGEITREVGYEETLIIMDGTTTDGVGGGVCQVSTTLFRAALFAGLPIVERTAHGYRVAYYEQGADPGLDATVYSPVVDFKFRNDTGGWLLVETEADAAAATLTFRFYGTKPAREVEILPAQVGGTVPPPAPRVVVDPALAPGETRILEHARAGASATVTRVIRENGEERREVFRSHYRPTGQVTAVAAGAGGVDTPTEASSEVAQAPAEGAGPDSALP